MHEFELDGGDCSNIVARYSLLKHNSTNGLISFTHCILNTSFVSVWCCTVSLTFHAQTFDVKDDSVHGLVFVSGFVGRSMMGCTVKLTLPTL